MLLVDEMVEVNPFNLFPLFIPEYRKRLLIIGWHPYLLTVSWDGWSEIEVYVNKQHCQIVKEQLIEVSSAKGLPIKLNECIHRYSPTTILVYGVGPYGCDSALPQEVIGHEEIHFVGIMKRGAAKKWISKLPKETWVMEGLPITGTQPFLWTSRSESQLPWYLFNPRGRFERPWIKAQHALRQLLFPIKGMVFIVNGKTSLLAKLITKASPIHKGPGSLWYHTKKDSLFVFLTDYEPWLILKIPLTDKAVISLKLHYQHLAELRNKEENSGIRELLPDPQMVSAGGFLAGVERIIRGISAYQLLAIPYKLKRVMYSAADVLCEWQKKQAVHTTIDSRLFEQFWEIPLRPLQDMLEANDKGVIYKECIDALKDKTLGIRLPLVPIHGDFWLNNILFDPENYRITGILDWDESSSQGLPLLDLFHLLYWRTHYLYDLHSRWTLFQTLKRNFPGKSGKILREYCVKLNIPLSQLSNLFCRYWMGEAARKIEEFMTSKESLRALMSLHRYLIYSKDKYL